MSGYTKEDAANDTNVSIKDVSRSWHDSRDDATKTGDFIRGLGNVDNEKASLGAYKDARETFIDVITDAYGNGERGNESYK